MADFLLRYLETRKFCLEEGIRVGWLTVFKESWDSGKAFMQQCQDLLSDTIDRATNASGSLGRVRAVIALWGMVEI